MNTISKRDLVLQISEQSGLTQTETYNIIALLIQNISGHLAKNNEVVLRNFGTFEVRLSKPKVGRNPRIPGKDVAIPARTVVKFVPGKELKERVAQLLPALTHAQSPA